MTAIFRATFCPFASDNRPSIVTLYVSIVCFLFSRAPLRPCIYLSYSSSSLASPQWGRKERKRGKRGTHILEILGNDLPSSGFRPTLASNRLCGFATRGHFHWHCKSNGSRPIRAKNDARRKSSCGFYHLDPSLAIAIDITRTNVLIRRSKFRNVTTSRGNEIGCVLKKI